MKKGGDLLLAVCVLLGLPGRAFAQGQVVSLAVSAADSSLHVGESTQLTVTGILQDGSQVDLTAGSTGTFYSSIDQNAGVSQDGLVTLTGIPSLRSVRDSGLALVSATHAGLISFVRLTVLATDLDGDGMDDTFEQAHGLDPGNALDAALDQDGDGRSNVQEFRSGTNPADADTDDDGMPDGVEVLRGTDPLNAANAFVSGQACTATALNRTITIGDDESFVINNIPASLGFFHVTVVCTSSSGTVGGRSRLLRPLPGNVVDTGDIPIGVMPPSVSRLRAGLSDPGPLGPGATAQLTVSATLSDGSTIDATAGSAGSTYVTSNRGIAQVDADGGVVAGISSGTAVIGITNDGVFTSIPVSIAVNQDRDGDGLPDDYETSRGLDPQDPNDAVLDPDGDALTSLQEFQSGTDPQVFDTDGDGIGDGAEISLGSNPVSPDSDGDGLLDGLEPAGDLDGDGLPNVLDRDSDGDQLPDGLEIRMCGTIACADPLGDNDGDQLINRDEVVQFTDPLDFDTDGDGLGDGEEVLRGTDPLVPDRTPPVVALTVPTGGTTLMRGETVSLGTSATDDGRVTRVDFLVNGAPAGSATTPPFTVLALVPADGPSVSIEAIARDTNGNTASSGGTSFPLANDSLTTVVGLVQDAGGAPAAGAAAGARAPRIVVETGGASISGGGMTTEPGTQIGTSSLSGTLAFGQGERPLLDALVDLEPAGAANVSGALTLDFTGYNPGSPTAVGGTLTVTGTAAAGLSLTFSGPIGGVVPVTGQTPLEVELPVTAFDPGGFPSAQTLAGRPASIRLEGSLQLQVVPGTTDVTAMTIDAELEEALRLDLSAMTGTDGRFSIPGVPTIYGDLVVDARLQPSGQIHLQGSSGPTRPVRGGTTDVGTIRLGEPPPLAFFPYPVFLVGTNPVAVAAGDFNRDGVQDLATANHSSNDVSVLLGNGDGTYGTQTRLASPFSPYSLAAVDLNADGRLDLVSSNLTSNNISIFLGNGNGTFQTRILVGVGSSPIALVAGDLDNDARPDLVVANRDSNALSILLGRGDGSFRPETRIPVAGAPRALALDDLNADGSLDVAVVNVATNDVAVLIGAGDGTFLLQSRYPAESGANGIASGDLNSDGRPDLAVANYHADTVSIFLGDGDGTFSPRSAVVVGDRPIGVAIADMNGGGFSDLVVTNQASNDISVLLGNGDGTFRPQSRFPAVLQPAGIVVADLDRDGTADLGVANQSDNNVQVLFGTGSGGVLDQNRVAVSGLEPKPRSIAALDFNTDGDADFAVAEQSNGRISLYAGNGDGTFRPPAFVGVGNTPLQVAAGDLNNDGRTDLVVTVQNTDSVAVLLSNGDGSFASSSLPLQASSLPRPVTLTDFNGDGKLDLAVGRQTGGIDIFLGNGAGVFTSSGRFATNHSGFISLAPGDFNGDEKKDLAFTDGGLGILTGNGDGTLGPAVGVAAGVVVEWAVAGDFDGNGADDLAAANLFSNDVTVSLSNGDGTFRAPVSYHVGEGQSPLFVTRGDFNADGKVDLAMTNGETNGRASDDAVILLGRGDGTFLAGPRLGTGLTPMGIAPADYNDDGRLDLAVVNRDSQSVSVLLNRGP